METVVSKSKKDITFSTIGLGCQSFKSLTYDIPSRRSLSFFFRLFLMKGICISSFALFIYLGEMCNRKKKTIFLP